MRLWVRLASVVAAVAIALVALTGYAAMRVSTGKATLSAEQALERDARSLAQITGSWLQDRVAAIDSWTRPFNPGSQEHGAGLLAAMIQGNPAVMASVIVGAEDGVLVVGPVYNTPDGTYPGTEAEDQARANALLERLPISEVQGSQGVLGDPYLPPGADVFSVPVAARGGAKPWVLGAEVTLAPVGSVLRAQTSEERAIVLIDGTGQPMFGGGHPLVEVDELAPLLGLDIPTFDQTLGTGRLVTGAMVAVPETNWTLAVVAPVEVAERTAGEIRRWTLQLMLASFALAVLAGLVTARSLARPVRLLRDSALSVADGDYQHRVDDERSDELGDLGRAFNHMTERLSENALEIQTQQGEIEAFNRELQQRVEERTKELREAQERLVRSSQLAAVAQLGAGLAHELNNPLAGLLGLTQVLRSRNSDPSTGVLLEQIEVQGERCREVVEAMVRASRGEVDPLDAPVIEVEGVLRDVLEQVRAPFAHSQVELVLETAGQPVRARVHEAYVARILLQLMDCLRSGLPEGATVRARGVDLGGEVAVELTADAEVAVGASRDDWMASGMALWVARQMLAQVGGRLEEPDGAGTWRVVLPGGPRA